ncbi:MAG: hypothetical protein M0Q27_03220 [Candidatus Colwellbacteria bacterium]|nr:hypothetical protein [Candidatus Colwellbacteria bacterium]
METQPPKKTLEESVQIIDNILKMQRLTIAEHMQLQAAWQQINMALTGLPKKGRPKKGKKPETKDGSRALHVSGPVQPSQ